MRYPAQSKVAFGPKRGCFEIPSNKEPTRNIVCKDILPSIYSDRDCDRQAMEDPNPLRHPDSSSLVRYCLGTGLQMRADPSKSSHKTVECSYHDADLCTDGKMIKSMTQEAMQMCRKFRTIQQVCIGPFILNPTSPSF